MKNLLLVLLPTVALALLSGCAKNPADIALKQAKKEAALRAQQEKSITNAKEALEQAKSQFKELFDTLSDERLLIKKCRQMFQTIKEQSTSSIWKTLNMDTGLRIAIQYNKPLWGIVDLLEETQKILTTHSHLLQKYNCDSSNLVSELTIWITNLENIIQAIKVSDAWYL